MKALIMLNGEYGDLKEYQIPSRKFDYIVCADGGANRAKELEINPDLILGDMDSISDENYNFYKNKGVEYYSVPSQKDFTDFQLGLDILKEKGYKDITVWGGTGGRIDHTFANIICSAGYVKAGLRIVFQSPYSTIHVIKDTMMLKGNPGETVSIIALGGDATKVSLVGFKYPLNNADMGAFDAIGISNVMTEKEARILVGTGIIAVFHNFNDKGETI